MNNEVKLPMMLPPSVTYQSTAFVMGMLLAHDGIKDYYYNSYVKLQSKNTRKIWNIELQFADVLWGPICKEGIFELNLFHAQNCSYDLFIPFLKERIDQGNYLLFYTIDEFCLSHSVDYHRRHYIHDIYVYGYEGDEFCVMAYKDDKLQMFNLPQTDIRDAFFSGRDFEEDLHFCTCRPRELASVTVDFSRMKRLFKEYLEGDHNDNFVFGILVYQPIVNSLKRLQEADCKDKIDIRVFRMLWEHKVSMKNHIEKLSEDVDVDDAISRASEIEEFGKKIFRLAIKHRMVESDSTITKMIDLLQDMERKEKEYLTELTNKF